MFGKKPKEELKKPSREKLDIAIANMFSNPDYANDYMFYAHMIAKCRIVLDPRLPDPAGVMFHIDHYNLIINPEFFDKFTLIQHLGILKHEMLHILNNHVGRLEDRKPLPFNFATDCAINQMIKREHLPDGVIYPDTFPVKVKENENAETYYEALKDKTEKQNQCQSCSGSGESEDQCSKCKGSGEQDKPHQHGDEGEPCNCCGGSGKEPCQDCDGSGQQGSYGEGHGKLVDDHGTWKKSVGDKELQKDITKSMIDSAINNTQKSRGNLPSNIDHFIQLFTRKAQISWKRVLRGIVGNKRVNSRRTIMRADRRFPKREDLRGKTKDRLFDLVVILDVSGSMSDNEIITGLTEIQEICRITKSGLKIIQVDTKVHEVTDFDASAKKFNRSGAGGTVMEPAINYIREKKVPHDAIVLITDSYIENIAYWNNPPKCRMMFLITEEGGSIPGIENYKRYQQFHLRNQM